MRFRHAIDEAFPGAIRFDELRWRVRLALRERSLIPENTLFANVICRDELNTPSLREIAGDWGENFSLAGLGGFPSAGLTGFGAYAQHCPPKGTLFLWAGPHIGVSQQGELGRVERRGLPEPDTACGSLLGFLGKIEVDGGYLPELSELDAEQYLVESALVEQIPALLHIAGAEARAVRATELLYQAIERRVFEILGRLRVDRRVVYLGGILINTPAENDFFAIRKAVLLNFSGKGSEYNWAPELV